MRVLPFLALLALAGCSASPGMGGERACSLIAAPAGVSVAVAPGMEADTATLELCWDGSCRSLEVTLRDATETVESTCGPDAEDGCSARARQTGGQHGFAEFGDLPDREVEVTLTVFGAAGDRLAHRALRVTPQKAFPNGRECDAGGPQFTLDVSADGSVAVSR